MTDTTQLDLVVAANFTAEPVGDALDFWLRELQLAARIHHAPFDQVFQQLLDPGSLLRRQGERGAIGLVLLRLQPWLACDDETGASPDRLAGEIVDAVRVAVGDSPTQLVLAFCPGTPEEGEGDETAARVENLVAEALQGDSGVRVLTSASILERYPCARIADAHGERMASMPYTPEFFSVLGTALARCIYALTQPAHKVLVLDCDDTLWGGLCSELGPHGVALTEEHLALQRFAVEQRRDGKLICLASRNNEADVFAVFDQNPAMTLTREDITAWQIHWGLKSDSLAELAAKLGLGLSSFVFLDDDPVQCAEVRRRFPEVLALQVPKRGVDAFCRHLWPLDRRTTTAEGSRRTGSYRDHVSREDVRASSQSFQQFLDSLELDIDIAPLAESDVARASELTFRTNQFNLTGLRLSEAEFRNHVLLASKPCFGVRVRDRFGDYGLVGLIMAEPDGAELRVPILLLSCRSLGRGVEHRMVARLGRLARDLGSERVRFDCTPSERNDPVREFLRQLGEVRTADDGTRVLTLETGQAESVQLALDAAPLQVESPITGAAGADGDGHDDVVRRVAFLATIPTTLSDAEAIFAAVHPKADSESEVEPENAVDPVEALLTSAFADQLGISDVPGDVGFFELGGQSLQAMQVLAQISNAFGVELAPTLLFTTNFTVEELAEEIRFLRAEDEPALSGAAARLSTTPGG